MEEILVRLANLVSCKVYFFRYFWAAFPTIRRWIDGKNYCLKKIQGTQNHWMVWSISNPLVLGTQVIFSKAFLNAIPHWRPWMRDEVQKVLSIQSFQGKSRKSFNKNVEKTLWKFSGLNGNNCFQSTFKIQSYKDTIWSLGRTRLKAPILLPCRKKKFCFPYQNKEVFLKTRILNKNPKFGRELILKHYHC